MKYHVIVRIGYAVLMSRPSRGAWIEIICFRHSCKYALSVAPLAGRVD